MLPSRVQSFSFTPTLHIHRNHRYFFFLSLVRIYNQCQKKKKEFCVHEARCMGAHSVYGALSQQGFTQLEPD